MTHITSTAFAFSNLGDLVMEDNHFLSKEEQSAANYIRLWKKKICL